MVEFICASFGRIWEAGLTDVDADGTHEICLALFHSKIFVLGLCSWSAAISNLHLNYFHVKYPASILVAFFGVLLTVYCLTD